MRFTFLTLLIVAVIMMGGLFITPSIAMDPDTTVTARQAIFKDYGKAMKKLGEINKSGDVEGQRAAVIEQASIIHKLSAAPWNSFGQETSVARVKTEAKATIWADPAAFKKAQDDFMAASDALVQVAAKGDSKAIAEKIGALGATCGACHKQFKN